MGSGDRLYRFQLAWTDRASAREEQLDLRVALHPSESVERLVLRVLARGLWSEPRVEMSPALCQGDKPPLSILDDAGRIRVAIEVGRPSPARLERAARRYPELRLLTDSDYELSRVRVRRPLDVLRVERGFASSLANAIEARNRWTVEQSEELSVTTERGSFTSRMLRSLVGG